MSLQQYSFNTLYTSKFSNLNSYYKNKLKIVNLDNKLSLYDINTDNYNKNINYFYYIIAYIEYLEYPDEIVVTNIEIKKDKFINIMENVKIFEYLIKYKNKTTHKLCIIYNNNLKTNFISNNKSYLTHLLENKYKSLLNSIYFKKINYDIIYFNNYDFIIVDTILKYNKLSKNIILIGNNINSIFYKEISRFEYTIKSLHEFKNNDKISITPSIINNNKTKIKIQSLNLESNHYKEYYQNNINLKLYDIIFLKELSNKPINNTNSSHKIIRSNAISKFKNTNKINNYLSYEINYDFLYVYLKDDELEQKSLQNTNEKITLNSYSIYKEFYDETLKINIPENINFIYIYSFGHNIHNFLFNMKEDLEKIDKNNIYIYCDGLGNISNEFTKFSNYYNINDKNIKISNIYQDKITFQLSESGYIYYTNLYDINTEDLSIHSIEKYNKLLNN